MAHSNASSTQITTPWHKGMPGSGKEEADELQQQKGTLSASPFTKNMKLRLYFGMAHQNGVHCTQLADIINRYQSNRRHLGCGGTKDSHYRCAAN